MTSTGCFLPEKDKASENFSVALTVRQMLIPGPMARPTSSRTAKRILIGTIVCFLFLGAAFYRQFNPAPPSVPNDSVKALHAAAERHTAVVSWQYSDTADPMGRGAVKSATIATTNQVQFRFPYQGIQRATLTLRIHPQYGRDIILDLDRAHFLCSSIDGCQVAVRFDKGKSVSYSALPPEDHSTDTLFIRNYSRFIASLKRATKLFIEAQFYQDGVRIFEFDVAGLVWEQKPLAKKPPPKKSAGNASPEPDSEASELDRARERLINEAVERGRQRLVK